MAHTNQPRVLISVETTGPSFDQWWCSLVESDRLMLREAKEAECRAVESEDPRRKRALEKQLTKIAALYGREYEDLMDLLDQAEEFEPAEVSW